MPNTKSAKKALRQAQRRRVVNIRKKRALASTLKNFEKALEAKNKAEALRLFPLVQKELDKSAKTHIITKNTASRKKSRLAARLKKLSA
ncbi:MAG: 30S ribosomal protein S20 [Candidatus Ryanbacteria bacterium RIFCSPHIGHO2_12_FULL_47_12b]|uniref:Small ribosomal subunit protein bS20 n=2 Tax=Candidatus Ryaniibacteriota TaxID=1817914 RepID=A0A1G2H5C3_9BACT|nr:MAG: 30S ribosomal protein S20 [Parcubacteria group bacterium GW2011_GWA2_47_10b]OGZ47422.1 MAG: 30S ribosomal protein S20 [Candidatus Ryanbacteria bacterium RIFCSPHIGHO2_01_FULL_48_80]OGZ50531.1 MAG: 30S ribosomal protein S20 [Candidatus Ryanbacteria bacterium RIFCSPHIGHO2_02_FULL_47_25]OGZ52671.1 MAG: 30S ribosomal protein S20 [Candidatus Ryanbacteria bacterium RIFCSPLOWO2_01_FULL_47_79]OGZ53115.1 MAG: 30S ribosomal protein S20 [Candidatus Ryanbacteria bacterium RIFCSPHIGHO2_12_FULL_47_12b